MNDGRTILAVIGSYADAADTGLHVCRFDTEQGSLEIVDRADGLQNPTFVAIDPSASRVYSIMEEMQPGGTRGGAAAAFDLDRITGRLTRLNEAMTTPKPTCHISLDRTAQSIVVSSYHGGMLGIFPVMRDGSIGKDGEIYRHEGASVLPVQNQPRVHSVFFDPGNRFAVVSDLGLDRIFVYKLDIESRRLIMHSQVQTRPASGPRHFAFHPSLPYGYVINELNATITGFRYDAGQGQLAEIQTISTLPDDYKGDNACADIHISPDGRYLYGSNRGHDSIAVYAIDPVSGQLALVEHVSTLGGHPRNFAIAPDGRFVLVANRDGNNIVTFARNADTGTLVPTGSELRVSKPVCIQFAAR